jgi:hypothetical protein
VKKSPKDATILDIRVYAAPDSGGRGRPRVVLDLVAVLCAANMHVREAFVSVISAELALDGVSEPLLDWQASTLPVQVLATLLCLHYLLLSLRCHMLCYPGLVYRECLCLHSRPASSFVYSNNDTCCKKQAWWSAQVNCFRQLAPCRA